MTTDNTFAERLNRIAEQRADAPAPVPGPAPAARKRSSYQSGQGGLPVFAIVAAVVLTGAAIVGLKQFQGLSASYLTPQGAVARMNSDNQSYQDCVNDPVFRAKLKAQGHTAIDTAAMLLCQ